jgi:hypothetical protein
MAPGSHGHQFLNNTISGPARVHFGDVHNEKTVVWNTSKNYSEEKCKPLIAAVHVVVQASGGNGRQIGLSDNVRSPALDKKINEGVESLLRNIDPEFKEITMY